MQFPGFDTDIKFEAVPGMTVLHKDYSVDSKLRNICAIVDASSQFSFGVHNNSLANIGRALHERVFRVSRNGQLVEPPRPLPGVFERCIDFRSRWLRHVGNCPRFSRQDVVDCYKSGKKKLYQNALKSLQTDPVTEFDARTTAFVKADKLNLSRKPDPAPRLIQPRSVRYNIELGTYLRLNEKRMLKAIDLVFGSPTIMKGLNVSQVGRAIVQKWERFTDPVAIGLDASRFDQHCSRQALQYEHSFYKSVFKGEKLLADLLRWQEVNKGVARCNEGEIQYEVEGCRMSGDINTSLGNCIIMCGLIHTYMNEHDLDCEVVNNGDDNVLILEREHLHKVANLGPWFLEFGYTLTLEDVVDEIEKIEFCQSQPIWTPFGYRMVRQPKNAVAKDCYTMLSMQYEKDFRTMLGAVGICGKIINDGIPVQSAQHECFYRNGNKKVEVGSDIFYSHVEYGNNERVRGLTYHGDPIHASTRVSYYKAFGIDPDTQVKLEKQWDEMDLSYGIGPLVVKCSDSPISTYCKIPAILVDPDTSD